MSVKVKNSGDAIFAEKKLIKKCLKGDKKAWDDFVDQYKRIIYNAIIKALAVAGRAPDENIKNDLFQDVFAMLLKDDYAKLRGFGWKNGCSLASWLYIVAKNRTFDYLKGRDFQINYVFIDDESKESELAIQDGESFIKDIEEAEAIDLLRNSIKKLPCEDQQFISLVYDQQIPYASLATLLGKSVAAVYMQKKRIIEELMKIVKKQEKGIL